MIFKNLLVIAILSLNSIETHSQELNKLIHDFLKPDSKSIVTIFRTRDFWNSRTDLELEEAFNELGKKHKIAEEWLTKHFGYKGKTVTTSETGFEWMKVQNAIVWEKQDTKVLLYAFKADKEFPYELQLYKYSSIRNPWENEHVKRLRKLSIRKLPTDQKVKLLNSPQLSKDDYVSLIEYTREFPKKALIESILNRVDDFSDYPSKYLTKEKIVEMMNEKLTLVIKDKEDDVLEPPPHDEELALLTMNEQELIQFLDSNDVHPKLRSLAFLRVLDFPSEEMIDAVRRNSHKPHYESKFFKLEVLLKMARDERK